MAKLKVNELLLRDYGVPALELVDSTVQETYLAALCKVAEEGGISDVEEKVLDELANSVGVSTETLGNAKAKSLGNLDLPTLLSPIDSLYLVRDAIRLAYADGLFDDDEKQVVEQIARAAGISTTISAAIAAFVKSEQDLKDEWWKIVEGTAE
jgi:tellurite resistance protein